MSNWCPRWRGSLLLCLLAVAALCTATVTVIDNAYTSTIPSNETHCDKFEPSSENFPEDLMTDDQRRHGGFVINFFIAFYAFIVIAFVCNDYFLPSVDCICQDLGLSQDVAGATFMALATCSPELFTNLIGTFITQSDLGVGTVVGSGVFNTLGVPACGGIAATTMVIRLKMYPLARDCAIYMIVVAVLAILLWDETIYWYESMVLLILYLVYCIIMFFDGKFSNVAKKILKKTNSFDSSRTIKSEVNDGAGTGVYRPTYHHGEQLSSIERARSPSLKDPKTYQVQVIDKERCAEQPVVDDTEKASMCVKPKGFWDGCWWIFTLPVEIVLWLSIPNCRVRRKLYPFTFLMCIVWIGIASYVVSWMMSLVGSTFSISDSVMGITFLAIGGSMPEACSSIINARLGIGSMSISNALGANTLDILLCLGLPWMVKTLLPTSMGGGPITIQSAGLVYNTAAQIACVAILFIAASLNSFHFNRVLGVICLFMYLAFIGFIIIVETNVFGWTNKKSSCI